MGYYNFVEWNSYKYEKVVFKRVILLFQTYAYNKYIYLKNDGGAFGYVYVLLYKTRN